jgi:catechol 2,3-dioxygenase-like lactoylglutathione lyase family enzyme
MSKVSEVRYVGYAVPDLEVERTFYRDFAPRQLDRFSGGYGFRFFSADGLPFEISSDVTSGSARVLKRGEGIPEKISHIVLHSPRHKEATQFFIDVLGFKLTDWIGDFMSFLRCNEWHHRIAILPGPPCLNHIAYDMPSVDDMMRGIGRSPYDAAPGTR